MTLMQILTQRFHSCAVCLCYSSSFCAIFPNGRFLLDVDRGSLSLPVCCKSLQYQRQDEGFTWIFMG